MFETIDRLILFHEASGELVEIVWDGANASIARAPEHLVRDLRTALAMPIPAKTGILLPDGARGTLVTQLKPGTFEHFEFLERAPRIKKQGQEKAENSKNLPKGVSAVAQSLTGFGIMAKEHWKEHRPKMYRALEKAGQLEKALLAAQGLTEAAMGRLLLQAGLPYDQAWELVREEWILLPTEEDVPVLGTNPGEWEPPPEEDE